ncbi:MAG TPA: site-specific integrase [Chthonomonadaceae bacterium]|nr:site-specific integrase [Chthonomonadaceae bacterium]
MLLLNGVIEDYLSALRCEQGAALTTFRTYRAHLHHFHDWLTQNGYPEPAVSDFTVPVCRRFLYYLAGKNLRPRSVRSYFHALRGVGAFLVEQGALTENPAKAVNMPKKDAALRKTVTDEPACRGNAPECSYTGAARCPG